MAEGVIEFDPEQLASIARQLGSAARMAPRVLSKAINDTAQQTKRSMARRARAQFSTEGFRKGIEAKYVQRLIKVVKKANAGDLSADIQMKDTVPVSLKYFSPIQNKAGVSVKILKGGTRVTIPSAFGPKIEKLGKGVFKRVGQQRLPLKKLKTDKSVAEYFRDLGQINPTVAETEDRLEKNIERRVREQLLRASGVIKK